MATCRTCGCVTANRHFCERCGRPLSAAGVEVDRVDQLANPASRDAWDSNSPTVEQVPTLEQPAAWAGPPVRVCRTAPPPPPMPRPVVAPPVAMMPVVAPGGHLGPPYLLVPVHVPPKSKAAAALFAFFLGGLGVHRFYLGHTGLGAVFLVLFVCGFVTCGLTWIAAGIWALIDLVLILSGSVRDSFGRPLI